MKILISGNDRKVKALFKQAKNSGLEVSECIDGKLEEIKEVEEVTKKEIREFLNKKGVKFHKGLGIKKLTILYNENK